MRRPSRLSISLHSLKPRDLLEALPNSMNDYRRPLTLRVFPGGRQSSSIRLEHANQVQFGGRGRYIGVGISGT